LNINDAKFAEDLPKLCKELDVNVYFDAVCGPDSGKIFTLLPNESVAYVYGALAGPGKTFPITMKELFG